MDASLPPSLAGRGEKYRLKLSSYCLRGQALITDMSFCYLKAQLFFRHLHMWYEIKTLCRGKE
jgi:hypothetical protein